MGTGLLNLARNVMMGTEGLETDAARNAELIVVGSAQHLEIPVQRQIEESFLIWQNLIIGHLLKATPQSSTNTWKRLEFELIQLDGNGRRFMDLNQNC